MDNKLLKKIGESVLFTIITAVTLAIVGGVVGGFTGYFTALGTDHVLLEKTVARVDATEITDRQIKSDLSDHIKYNSNVNIALFNYLSNIGGKLGLKPLKVPEEK